MKAFGRNLRTSKSKKYHCKIVWTQWIVSLTEGVSTRSAGSRITIITDDAICAFLSIGCFEAICVRHSSTWNLFLLKICCLNCRSTLDFLPSVVAKILAHCSLEISIPGFILLTVVGSQSSWPVSKVAVSVDFVFVLCCCVVVIVIVILIVLPEWGWIYKKTILSGNAICWSVVTCVEVSFAIENGSDFNKKNRDISLLCISRAVRIWDFFFPKD